MTIPVTPPPKQFATLPANNKPLTTALLVPGFFYRAIIDFPETQIDESSPLARHKTPLGDPPLFPSSHLTKYSEKTHLYKAKPRIVLVTHVSEETAAVFLCSTAPRAASSRANSHRWVAINHHGILPNQPNLILDCLPQTSFRSKPYLCFTHAIEITILGQGETALSSAAPGHAHLSVPFNATGATGLLDSRHIPGALATHPNASDLITLTESSFAKLLLEHEAYWLDVRYNGSNQRIIPKQGANTDMAEEENDSDNDDRSKEVGKQSVQRETTGEKGKGRSGDHSGSSGSRKRAIEDTGSAMEYETGDKSTNTAKRVQITSELGNICWAPVKESIGFPRVRKHWKDAKLKSSDQYAKELEEFGVDFEQLAEIRKSVPKGFDMFDEPESDDESTLDLKADYEDDSILLHGDGHLGSPTRAYVYPLTASEFNSYFSQAHSSSSSSGSTSPAIYC